MRIEEQFRHGVAVIALRGRLTIETAAAFSEAVRRLLEAGRRRLVLNLADVRYIDACGLGAITLALVQSQAHGGDLRLLHLTGRNHHLFTITKLLTVMDAFDSEEEARRSFDTAESGDSGGFASYSNMSASKCAPAGGEVVSQIAE